MATNLTTDNIKTLHDMTSGIPAGSDELLYWDAVNSTHKKAVLGAGIATALVNNLNWGRTANAADIPLLTTDVITSLPHVGDYAAFASTAPNVPDAHNWYVMCEVGGYSVTGARYRARRTGGYEYIGDIITAGTITWMPVELNCVTSVTANYTISDYDRKIIINTADAVTLTIPEGLSLYRDIEIQRVVASTNAVTVATSGSETIEDATTFITHGSTSSSFLNTQIVRITKTNATAWHKHDLIASSAVITPVFTGSDTSTVRIVGRMVFIQIRFSFTTTGTLLSGALIFNISGLPVTNTANTYRSVIVFTHPGEYNLFPANININVTGSTAVIEWLPRQEISMSFIANMSGLYGSAAFYLDE